MSPEDAQNFLSSQVDNICGFMDYEVSIHSQESFYQTLFYGLGSHRWQESGCEFIHLGHSGSGSEFAIWLRPNDDLRPVVFFGGEGGNGVLAASAENFVKALTYGPYAMENHRQPSRLCLIDDQVEGGKEALSAYRHAVNDIYSDIEPFESLTAGLEVLNNEFAVFSENYNDHADPTVDSHASQANVETSLPVESRKASPPKKIGFFARLFGKK